MNRRHSFRRFAALSLIAFGCASALPAMAASSFQTGTGTLNATASLDFQVVIPKFISFQVGSSGTAVDLVTFTVPAANVGDGTDIAGSSSIPVTLLSNGGNVSLTGTTLGTLNNGSGSTISYAEILSSSSNSSLAAPTLVDGAASSAVTVTPNVGTQVVNRTATWSFAYSNSNYVAAGTYGGVNVNNGRVTYTASLP